MFRSKEKSPGQRGKTAEAAVKKYLESVSAAVAEFDFGRIPDARSAGGRFPSTVADFDFYRKIKGVGHFGMLDAKEVAHDFRLPAKNFKPGQMGKMEKRRLAGGIVVVAVLHTTSGKWRVPNFSWMYERSGTPSWDLSEFPLFNDVGAALRSVALLS